MVPAERVTELERVAELERVTELERVAELEREAPDALTTDERVDAPERDTDEPADLVARDSALLRADPPLRPRETVLWEAAPRALKLSTR